MACQIRVDLRSLPGLGYLCPVSRKAHKDRANFEGRSTGVKRVRKIIFYGLVGILLGGFSSMVWAQLVAVDDSYGVPVAEPLLVETPGVLDNDSYKGEPAEDGGATGSRQRTVGPPQNCLLVLSSELWCANSMRDSNFVLTALLATLRVWISPVPIGLPIA